MDGPPSDWAGRSYFNGPIVETKLQNLTTMRYILPLMILSLMACKNNGSSTAPATTKQEPSAAVSSLKPITVDANHQGGKKPDFSVQSWNAKGDTLEVILMYSGGCQEHDFKAFFSGGWLKSFPPRAMVDVVHLNPNNDNCRSLITDTLLFDMRSLRYDGSKEVLVSFEGNADFWTKYVYGK